MPFLLEHPYAVSLRNEKIALTQIWKPSPSSTHPTNRGGGQLAKAARKTVSLAKLGASGLGVKRVL